jgi:hypothetical protein
MAYKNFRITGNLSITSDLTVRWVWPYRYNSWTNLMNYKSQKVIGYNTGLEDPTHDSDNPRMGSHWHGWYKTDEFFANTSVYNLWLEEYTIGSDFVNNWFSAAVLLDTFSNGFWGNIYAGDSGRMMIFYGRDLSSFPMTSATTWTWTCTGGGG